VALCVDGSLATMVFMESTARVLPASIHALGATPLFELSDVPGVIGALLVSSEGELLLEHLPAGWAGRASAAAPRLAVLLEALAAGRTMQRYCLRFYELRLHVLALSDAYLCVLSELFSPAPMLKMAMNVAARRLS
jgi:hypothetical protein